MSLRALSVFAIEGIGEITAGDDLAAVIHCALGGELQDGDILAVTSKIVSKAEGRTRSAADREEAITAETVRVVATRAHANGVTRIVENRLGIVSAAAGVDASNTPEGTILLLPVDPDASAHRLRVELHRRCGVNVAVVITDTLGRPWRNGQTDVAIGVSGLAPLADLRGSVDSAGRRLSATVTAVADEIAAAADLVKGKTSGCPVAVVRGLGGLVSAPNNDDDDDGACPGHAGAAALIRSAEQDMFRLGTAEAMEAGRQEGLKTGRREGFDAGRREGYRQGYEAGLAEAARGPASGNGLKATSGLPVSGCSSTTASTP
ncbi:coenzyme F420-0:L-glutamate ligase [Arthrobacter crystallopoietes]|uniref:Coenzyme F420-0:L-glutamate ligase / coenzyme F420-1:gamma-L-glutamate ligase n=1 Tax=Crystallibacter crystallopoietes TaxID=37928 RepID=A0A1H1AKQ2_9MICC|nr:coenzyme F420-0:L-glutamate ligase [Arthrobacter crystallopoietes]SDQ40220.1 coenzyme F420-0:L-glutamate ligase / coenzyme F420-1:gamma-L-glutamate ligase [Arthrobacter crystallopoietes]